MYDPISIWMNTTVFWAKLFQKQQDAYWRALGAFANTIPHEDAAELSREAEALKKIAKPERPARRTATQPKAAAKKPALA